MLDRILEIMSKYDKEDYKVFGDTIDMLCSKGIGNGCYQDMTVLMDILSILSICKIYLQEGNNEEQI